MNAVSLFLMPLEYFVLASEASRVMSTYCNAPAWGQVTELSHRSMEAPWTCSSVRQSALKLLRSPVTILELWCVLVRGARYLLCSS